jgi:hypothetical protein
VPGGLAIPSTFSKVILLYRPNPLKLIKKIYTFGGWAQILTNDKKYVNAVV